MKRSKRIYILLGVFAAVCIATVGVMQFEEHKEQIKNSDEIILQLRSDAVKSLSWEYGSEKLSFHRDEKWLYDADGAFPVDEEKIDALLEQFEEFGVSFIIENVEDYGQYGLDDPICTIDLATDEQSYEILLGNYSNMDSERYVSIGDGNVYLVKRDPLDYFDIMISDVIKHDDIPVFDKVEEIRFAGAQTYDIAYEEGSASTYCADDVYFTQKDDASLPLDTSRVERYLDNIRYLSLKDYVTYNASDEELDTYGLSEPELTVSVDYISENEGGEELMDTFVLNISQDPKEKKDTEDDEEEEVTAYARVGNSQIIYQISSDYYKELMDASYDSLRHLEVLSADFGDIDQMDISLEDTVYTITSEQKNGERIYYYQGEELETEAFRDALNNLKADRFTDDLPTQKEEISLTVYLDNENYPQVHIELYRYDGSDCLAVVDGVPISYIGRDSVVDLIEAVHAIVLN